MQYFLSSFPRSSSITGPMIEIVRDQVVYNAGSHLEVACIYKNTTGSKASQDSAEVRKVDEVQRILEVSRQGGRFNQDVPEDTILWLHNGNRFSHRNRRRWVEKDRDREREIASY